MLAYAGSYSQLDLMIFFSWLCVFPFFHLWISDLLFVEHAFYLTKGVFRVVFCSKGIENRESLEVYKTSL